MFQHKCFSRKAVSTITVAQNSLLQFIKKNGSYREYTESQNSSFLVGTDGFASFFAWYIYPMRLLTTHTVPCTAPLRLPRNTVNTLYL